MNEEESKWQKDNIFNKTMWLTINLHLPCLESHPIFILQVNKVTDSKAKVWAGPYEIDLADIAGLERVTLAFWLMDNFFPGPKIKGVIV